MVKGMLLFFILSAICLKTSGQVYYTKNGNISFFSKTILENISAENNQVIGIINFQTGLIQFSLLNNAFHFSKAKMEEDFNDNFIEIDKYPRSEFKGIIANAGSINLNKDGTYKITVKGNLKIHGVTKNITAPAVLVIGNGKISGIATFKISIKDYKIKVPSIVTNKIADSVEINIRCDYQKK